MPRSVNKGMRLVHIRLCGWHRPHKEKPLVEPLSKLRPRGPLVPNEDAPLTMVWRVPYLLMSSVPGVDHESPMIATTPYIGDHPDPTPKTSLSDKGVDHGDIISAVPPAHRRAAFDLDVPRRASSTACSRGGAFPR